MIPRLITIRLSLVPLVPLVVGLTGLVAIHDDSAVTVAAMTNSSKAFPSHNAIPVDFTEEDFDQVASGNVVTKVVFLPSPEF